MISKIVPPIVNIRIEKYVILNGKREQSWAGKQSKIQIFSLRIRVFPRLGKVGVH